MHYPYPDPDPWQAAAVDTSDELGRALADAGGADAPRAWCGAGCASCCARSSNAARASWGRRAPVASSRSRWRSRPRRRRCWRCFRSPPELRADPGAVIRARRRAGRGGGRARLVEADRRGPARRGAAPTCALVAGEHDGFLALSYPAGDPRWSAEYAREALEDAARAIDRLRAAVYLLPGHAIDAGQLRPPIGSHPSAAGGRGGDAAGRLGARRGLASRQLRARGCCDLLEPDGAIRARPRRPPTRAGA